MWYVLIFKTQNGRGGCVDPTGARARSRASRYYLRMHKKEMKSHTIFYSSVRVCITLYDIILYIYNIMYEP